MVDPQTLVIFYRRSVLRWNESGNYLSDIWLATAFALAAEGMLSARVGETQSGPAPSARSVPHVTSHAIGSSNSLSGGDHCWRTRVRPVRRAYRATLARMQAPTGWMAISPLASISMDSLSLRDMSSSRSATALERFSSINREGNLTCPRISPSRVLLSQIAGVGDDDARCEVDARTHKLHVEPTPRGNRVPVVSHVSAD